MTIVHFRLSFYAKAPSMAETKRKMSTWLVVGASRGIGLEFVKQLLQRGDRVFATARDINGPKLKGWENGAHERCHILECDVASESSIQNCVSSLIKHDKIQNLDYVVINAGVLRYPNVSKPMCNAGCFEISCGLRFVQELKAEIL